MSRGNANDFINHLQLKDSLSVVGSLTTFRPQALHHLNPALQLDIFSNTLT